MSISIVTDSNPFINDLFNVFADSAFLLNSFPDVFIPYRIMLPCGRRLLPREAFPYNERMEMKKLEHHRDRLIKIYDMNGSLEEAEKYIQRLEEIVANRKGQYIDCISISCGAESSQNYSNVEAVVQEADRKMNESKNQYYISSGKDRRKQ